METPKSMTAGKYETFALCIDDPEMAQDYLNCCIEETIRAGIDRKKAAQIERDNIRTYFQRFDKRVQKKINALLGKGHLLAYLQLLT